MNNKYESPELVVIALNQDVITASLGQEEPPHEQGETPREEFDW